MKEIVLIAAVGHSGQLGLNGLLPWGIDYPEDLLRFRRVTTGHLVVFGFKTWKRLAHLDGTCNRVIIGYPSIMPPEHLIRRWKNSYPERDIYIAGGAKTYERWMPYITRFDITRLPYDGPADTWMPPISFGGKSHQMKSIEN